MNPGVTIEKLGTQKFKLVLALMPLSVQQKNE